MVAHGLPAENFRISLSRYREENTKVIAGLDAIMAKLGLPRVVAENVFCRQQYCQAYDGHDALYFDNHHLSVSGARKLAVLIKPLLAGAPPWR
jgi:hypothetical protein